MKASEAQRLVTLAEAQRGLPDVIEAMKARRKPGYDRVALVIQVEQIDEGVGSEEVEGIEVDLKTAEAVLGHIKHIIAAELERLGYEKE